MKIIIDAMGGDFAPKAPVCGGLQAIREFGVEVVFTGREDDIRAALALDGYEQLPRGVSIVSCAVFVEICDGPSTVWRKKPNSSMMAGLKLLRDGGGDAFLSAGSTGALLSGATLLVKRIKGIRRAAVAPTVPTAKGRAVLIDAGANSECTGAMLCQFALMGAYYAEQVMGIASPRVGLLNIGEEPSKGTELYQQTYQLLREMGERGEINFVGNVEGRNAVEGDADVIVADGFTGNIFLKTMEGTASVFSHEIKAILLASLKTKIAALLIRKGISAFSKRMDYREIGGTALLGISKPVIKAHGASDAYAFRSAVKQALDYAQGNVTEKIETQLNQSTEQEGEA